MGLLPTRTGDLLLHLFILSREIFHDVTYAIIMNRMKLYNRRCEFQYMLFDRRLFVIFDSTWLNRKIRQNDIRSVHSRKKAERWIRFRILMAKISILHAKFSTVNFYFCKTHFAKYKAVNDCRLNQLK